MKADKFSYFSKPVLATAHLKALAFLCNGTWNVPLKQIELVIVVCKWQRYGKYSVTQCLLRILYQISLSLKTLSMSSNVDSASILMTLSSSSSLRWRRLRNLVPQIHCSSHLEISFPYLEKLPLKSSISKFTFKIEKLALYFDSIDLP